ncbi:TPA: hypothetical protein OHP78_004933 [Escherichia coli]|nr:hypothetical protein [Enterobacter hormaechei]HCQ2992191.1 hypothetical protein [Escherichia coli]HCT1665805.1 hypothetical protein [Enterobacter hormaechei]
MEKREAQPFPGAACVISYLCPGRFRLLREYHLLAAAERPERSDRVSEEAEYILHHIFCLRSAAAFFSCLMKHFPDYRTHANILSQYTLR